jgi:integrase
MASVYRRKGIRFWWMCWIDAEGIEQWASTRTEDKTEAKAIADEMEKEARARSHRAALSALTVQRFYEETWLPLRQRTRQWAWKSDVAAMTNHFLPDFGKRALADLATDEGEVALLDWLIDLRGHKSQRDGTPIASRTVRNVASSVRVFFADAAERKVIPRNPTVGWDAERHLPAVEDKERGWRAQAGFSLEQVVTFTTDHRIPEDRRVLYALRFLGGPRPGEAANARWRDLNRTKRPLWRLTLESSFNSPMRQEKTTKTGAELNIPVHPVLQRMLVDWEACGWEAFMGRKPEPGDLIIPRYDGKHRLVSGTYKQFVADLDAVGIPRQRQYESRSTFRNLALAAGAVEFHVNMITHPKPKRASDHYTRLEMQWAAMCQAVLAIDPAAWGAPAIVSPDLLTIRLTEQGTTNANPPTTLGIVGGKMEREKGFEQLRAVNKNLRRDARLPHKGPEPLRKQASMAIHGSTREVPARNGPTAT